MIRFLFTLAVFALLSGVASATSPAAVSVEKPELRLMPGAKVGAVYMEIFNSTDVPDALVRVECEQVEAVEIHEMNMEGDMMQMRQMNRLELPPKSTTKLESGSTHIMLIGVKQPVESPITLKFFFEHAPPQQAVLEVAR